MKFCQSKLVKPEVFCSLPPGHHPPCSFHLSGDRANIAVQALRDEIARLTAPIEGLSPGPGYTMEDVELIERIRGKPYDRLRATVAQLAKAPQTECGACEFCIDGLPCRSRQ